MDRKRDERSAARVQRVLATDQGSQAQQEMAGLQHEIKRAIADIQAGHLQAAHLGGSGSGGLAEQFNGIEASGGLPAHEQFNGAETMWLANNLPFATKAVTIAPGRPAACLHASLRLLDGCIVCDCGLRVHDQALKRLGAPPYDRERMKLADECGRLQATNDELLRENATLRREVERLERVASEGAAMSDLVSLAKALVAALPRCQSRGCPNIATLTDIGGAPAYCDEHGGGSPTGYRDEAKALEWALEELPR